MVLNPFCRSQEGAAVAVEAPMTCPPMTSTPLACMCRGFSEIEGLVFSGLR